MEFWKKIDYWECAERWPEAKREINSKWNENKNDIYTTIRLGTLCWYILVFWERINNEGLNQEEVNELLGEVTDYGMIKFKNDTEFLWIFGYMITSFPYYFGEYEVWENIGRNMIEKAYEIKTDDPIIAMLYLNGEPNDKYEEVCIEVRKMLNARFKDNGVMSSYFKRVFS